MNADMWSNLAREAVQTQKFTPIACYNAAGDSIEFHFSNEPYRAKRLGLWLTAFIGEESNVPVGGSLKSVVHGLLARFPGITKIEVRADGDERYPLSVLLRVAAYEDVDDSSLPVYLSLIRASEDSKLETTLQEA